ncbi:MAG: hypothetical protein M3033_06465 [Acidobacteriota bacterium]|nr:hypothetical protein [Acidobacteriota bacterium]
MKTIFRALTLALLLTAFTAVAVKPTFAQGDGVEENIALYKKYTDNRGGTVDQMQIAIEAGKQYIEKYGTNADYAAQIEFLKKDVPRLEKVVADIVIGQQKQALYKRFDASVQGKTYDDTYASGREILAGNPDLVDVLIVLGSIGYDESLKTPSNTKYNADTISYAKQAIQKIESGAKTENYGAYQYTYGGVKEFPDAKQNALGWLNYNIGYLMYFNQNMKKEAIPYLYKATQYNSAPKNFPVVYQTIGASYFDEAKRLSQESETKAKAAGDKDTDESKAAYAMAKGYADRAIDAYARAYKIASNNPATKKEYKDGLYKVLQDLFKFRYDGKIDTLDSYLATVMNKPFIDPSTPVTPVIEATPATTTANSSLSATSNTTVAASNESSKSTSAKVVTSTTVPATKATPVKTVVKTTAPAKKPAPKKKGTR